MADKEHVVYILKCKDNTLYTGYTNDLARRLRMHEEGKGAKYTRGRGPFEVEFVKAFVTKEEAMQHEYAIKQLSRSQKDQMIRLNKEEVKRNEHSKEL
ncbi:GIY-YIG nuclease family protein [Virgibacillus ndiopensis]|uniref:GIY-YIG nuclease family protein n=1 Tax=Virgibacillus ndiopensis TaxID=2004408 RepID=UPI000C08AF5A|nr:GIY-YIG nuclease family protein [Virgibacillus ndiopensis]